MSDTRLEAAAKARWEVGPYGGILDWAAWRSDRTTDDLEVEEYLTETASILAAADAVTPVVPDDAPRMRAHRRGESDWWGFDGLTDWWGFDGLMWEAPGIYALVKVHE